MDIGWKTAMEKKTTCFLKKIVASLFMFFEKVHAICEFSFEYMNGTIYTLLY